MLKALRESVHSQQGAPWGKEDDRERERTPAPVMLLSYPQACLLLHGTIWLLELILSMSYSK